MVMINMSGEGRTPAYRSMGSPKYGGCVSAFLHFFDWNPAKRFSSTKRLPANKPEKAMERSRGFRGDHGPEANTWMLQTCDAQQTAEEDIVPVVDHVAEHHHNEDASKRAPGVVARLMGLESLPEITQPYQPPQPHRRCQSYTGVGKFSSLADTYMDRDVDSDSGTPVLLQDLLRRDFKSGRRTLRDRLPGFAKRAQEEYEDRFTKTDAEALRCRQKEAVSAYIDIHDVQRRISGNSKPSFLSRLAPSTSSQRTTPLLPSKLHTPRVSPLMMSLEEKNHIPELTLQQAVGWPLAGQRIRDLDHESSHETLSFRSESDISTECANRRWSGSTWNGSEGSDLTDEQQVEELDDQGGSLPVQDFAHQKQRLGRESSTLKEPSLSSSSVEQRLRKSVSSNEASAREFKPSGNRNPVISPKLAAAQNLRTSSTAKANLSLEELGGPLIPSKRHSSDRSKSPVLQENSRSSSASLESTSIASQTSNVTYITTSVSPISEPSAQASMTGRLTPKFTSTTQTNMKADATAVKSVSKAPTHGKPPPLDGYRALKVRSPKVGQQDCNPVVSGSRVFPSAASPSREAPGESGSFLSYGRVLGAQKEGNKLPVFGERKFEEQEMGNGRHPSPTLSKQSVKDTLQRFQRVREKVLVTKSPTPNQALLDDRLNLENLATQNACRIVSKHARARSVDEVFPELPFDFDHSNTFTSSKCETDMTMCDEQQISDASLSQSIQRMFGQGFSHFDHFTDCGGGVSREIEWNSSPMIGSEGATEEILEQRVRSPLCARSCERSCSGPSISSGSVDASDVDDERQGDDWSSCASYNLADCDSPKTFALPDTDVDSDLPEQKSAASTFVKRFYEESDDTKTVKDVDQAEQPSPVSILNLPFHDEACTTSDSSPTDEDDLKSCTKYNDNAKIRQALLDISMFQSLEVFTFDYKERITPSAGPKEEQGFVQEILSAAHFLSTPGSSPNWFNRDLAIDPSLFDRLELSGDMDHAENSPAGDVEKFFRVSGGLWRCDRKLLFDCVNEAFVLVVWRSEMGLLRQQPRGQELVEEVYGKIKEWRKLASHGIESLIERDMCVDFGSWKHFKAEVVEVGLDIENMLWKAIVEEVVADILSVSKHR
ncbi:hypothetical protein KC19_5G093100 [Ceratodon purpureus]|uniref:DUF4378 domain-containing protein n=1 Tax=Ceratodon purpureus TaxID=3225 RepID=A0A8T0HZI7_CERPU|nr:hypothetical protein KC19_5G093100 [Ceratodon purpureus]